MKKLLLPIIACLLMFAGNINAKSLVLTLKDGTLVYYLLGGETSPMMRFVDGKVTVDADEYTISGIKNFYISEEDDPNSIEDIKGNKDFANYSNNTLIVKTSKTKSVKVFNINGAEMDADIQKSDDMTSVALNRLPKGAYIIRVGESSFKVIKK